VVVFENQTIVGWPS